MDLDHTLRLQQQIVRLQALLEASRRIHATIQLDQVLRAALEIVVRELEVAGAFFSSFPFSEGRVPPRFLMSLNHSEFGRGCVRFPLIDKTGANITDLMVIPRDNTQLTLEELDFLESLAVQITVAIENARHHERMVYLQRVEHDLASARAIQRSFLPQSLEEIPGYKIGLRLVSCYEVAGDYVDIVARPDGTHLMIVADVAGKGLASALIGSSFRSAFRAMAFGDLPPVQIATRLNALHYAEGQESRRHYVTVLLVQLDSAAHRLEVVNAGHNPAVLWPDHSVSHVHLKASGTPVGLLPFSSYLAETHQLAPGARLLAYTDGLTEVSRDEEEFGTERLIQSFLDCSSPQCEVALDQIWNTLEAFTTEREQQDDMTALILRRL